MKSRYYSILLLLVAITTNSLSSCNKDDDPVGNVPSEEEKADTIHTAVDLGLSVKWATCNVGATSPEDYGNYYAWAEIESKKQFDWTTYKWCSSSSIKMTKYCLNHAYTTPDKKKVIESSDDVATVKWDTIWRIPTDPEMAELRQKCKWTWTTQNGVNGYIVTGKNGNSIFLPAGGHRYLNRCDSLGIEGSYWTSSLSTNYSTYASALVFNDSTYGWNSYYRYIGRSIRPVCK